MTHFWMKKYFQLLNLLARSFRNALVKVFLQVQIQFNRFSDWCDNCPWILKETYWTMKRLIWRCFLTKWSFRVISTLILWLMNFIFFKDSFPRNALYYISWGEFAFVKQLLYISNITRASIKHSLFLLSFFCLSNDIVFSIATNFLKVVSVFYSPCLSSKMFHDDIKNFLRVYCGKIIY